MAVCRARSLSHLGIDAVPVEVEADVSAGLPGFSIVGLPDAAVLEARGRGFAGIKQRLQVPHEEGHGEPRARQPAYLGRSRAPVGDSNPDPPRFVVSNGVIRGVRCSRQTPFPESTSGIVPSPTAALNPLSP
jgi:hypothetical protein